VLELRQEIEEGARLLGERSEELLDPGKYLVSLSQVGLGDEALHGCLLWRRRTKARELDTASAAKSRR
jgi:hypothetical protein